MAASTFRRPPTPARVGSMVPDPSACSPQLSDGSGLVSHRCSAGGSSVQGRPGRGAAASVAIGAPAWAARNRALAAPATRLAGAASGGPGRRAQQPVGFAHPALPAAVQVASTADHMSGLTRPARAAEQPAALGRGDLPT